MLFDLDGTLADTIGLILTSYDHALRTVVGGPRPEDQVRPWIGRTLRAVFEDEYPADAADLERTYLEWNSAHAAGLIRPYAGVDVLVRALVDAQVRIGVVTSKRRATAAEVLARVGLDGLVDVVGAMEDTTKHKPDAAPLLHGAARLSTPVERCVYVGDAVVDVVAARAAGMASIAVTWGAGSREALLAAAPDVLVDDVPTLLNLLLPAADE